jgi:DNA mismatch repair protein MutS
MALTQTYYNLLDGYHTKYGKNTFLLMQVGSFFEVYSPTENGTNIVSFSQICDLKIANKQEGYMAGFRDYMIEKYLSKINESGYTSVVYVQEEIDGIIQRKESAVYSPGTTFLDDDSKLSNNATCIWIHKTRKDIVFGLSNLDIFTGKINLYEYQQVYYFAGCVIYLVDICHSLQNCVF